MAVLINTSPILLKDNLSMDEDTVLIIMPLANDRDADGDILNITAVEGLRYGRAIINSDNTITYTPNADYNGRESFLYTVSDGKGGAATQRINITINPVADEVEPNIAPTLGKDMASVDKNIPKIINVLANDSDSNGDTLTVTAAVGATHGIVTINADNTLTYTPNKNYAGADTFTYSVSDGNGGTATQRVNVTVVDTVPNYAPVLLKDMASVNEDSLVVINVLANDSDANGDTLTVTAVSGAMHGVVIINPDNALTYTPSADYNGAESFLYIASDGIASSTQRVNVTVNPVVDAVEPNAAPILTKDSATGNEDASVIINVLGNDRDANGDILSVTAVSGLKHGVAVINADNTITYTPTHDYFGNESFLYTVNDGHGGVVSQRVNVTVTSVSDADIEGTLGNDVALNGTSASESIAGLAGNDIINAGEGNDTVYGGYGNDTLFGGAGADMFVFEVGGGIDTVKDFNLEEGDWGNFDSLIANYDPLTESIHDFLSATTEGANTVVSFDRDGTGTEYDWQVVAIVENVILPPIEMPTV